MSITTGQVGPAVEIATVTNKDLPSWYQDYTSKLGKSGVDLAQNLNQQPLPTASVAGFNPDQVQAFDMTRGSMGAWQQPLAQAAGATSQTAPTAAKFIDYAQGAVGAPAMTTADAVQPWAQGAQDAASGSAQDWTTRYQQYMNPYTTAVVDNIARLGQRNFQDNIMPGIQDAMIGAGQFGSTRNADILSRAGVQAANDITGQQSGALQAGWNSSAGIFANDANRAQQQQQMQTQAALSGGNMMKDALTGDANRVQQQGQLQAQTALSGATGAVNALNTAADNGGALAQTWQTMNNTDIDRLMGIGNKQQTLQQTGYDTALSNANLARTDPWTQLKNAQGLLSGVQLPSSTTQVNSGPANSYGPSQLSGALAALFAAQGMQTP